MAGTIKIVNLDSERRINEERYREKAKINARAFDEMYGKFSGAIRFGALLFRFDEENRRLMKRIGKISGLSYSKVKSINIGDEIMNLGNNFPVNLGCTSIGRGGVIGQTMDLYDLELCVVREGGAVYVTFPPYLALIGMNKDIAFCTNFLESEVGRGAPVSQIRRRLLRYNTLEDAICYLKDVKKANSANFLLSDGGSIVDVETTRSVVNVKPEVAGGERSFNAHTNHIVEGDIMDDSSCPRLRKAVEMLADGEDLGKILDSDGISLPIAGGFGSIVKVVMDVKSKRFSYKDPRMSEYASLEV